MPDAEAIGNRRLVTPAALSLMTGIRPFWIRELVRLTGTRRYWIDGGPRLDPAEYARRTGTGPLNRTTGASEHYGDRGGALRVAVPRVTIGDAQKKRSTEGSTPRSIGDSEALATPRIADGTAPWRRHLAHESV